MASSISAFSSETLLDGLEGVVGDAQVEDGAVSRFGEKIALIDQILLMKMPRPFADVS